MGVVLVDRKGNMASITEIKGKYDIMSRRKTLVFCNKIIFCIVARR